MENITVTKKQSGRPKKEIQFNSATRQRMARGKAHGAFMTESNMQHSKQIAADMSTSNLISLLPTLMSSKWRVAVETVCDELVKRVNNN